MTMKSSEIMNIKVAAGSRTLYLELTENADSTRFLSISEVRSGSCGERSRILVDEEFVPDLHRALGAVLEMIGRKTPPQKQKSHTLEEKRREHSRAYEPWTDEEEKQVREEYTRGLGIERLAEQVGRKPTAVLSRLYQMGVIKHKEKPRW